VGRAALDEDAIRLIEEYNPRIQFDWTRILKGQADPDEPRAAPNERTESRRHPPPAQGRREPRAPMPVAPPPRAPALMEPPAAIPAGAHGSVLSDSAEAVSRGTGDDEHDILELAAEQEQEEQDAGTAEVDPGVTGDQPPTPAEARLGSEGLERLRGRYADIMAGIRDRVPEGPQREELNTQAERLNPDNWVTDDEVRLGLEQYESVFESLRPLAVRRRRRRRRRPGNPL
jgi:hypothetical protein